MEFLAKLYDQVDAEGFRSGIERWMIRAAAIGFVIHLGLIAASRSFPALHEGALKALHQNYLHAVYTPFSFILFYEVLLLVLALPQSHTSSVGKQYEIISLIIIRRVFKDIGEYRDPVTWLSQWDASRMVLMDMIAAALMFILVTLFYRVRKTVAHAPEPENLIKFLVIKKTMAVLLAIILVLLAIYSLGIWVVEAVEVVQGQATEAMQLNNYFFPLFFELMVLADVFLLIVSLPFFERYEYLIRNAGFVISTVLLRFSLSTPQPYDLAIGLVAMLYGLCILSVFAYHTRLANAQVEDAEDSQATSQPAARARPLP